jgi:PTH1 family peptidyl-tRNA hydrolase
MKLIIGLGNPGKDYTRNRHNIGFRCINNLEKKHSIPVKQRLCHARIGIGTIGDIKVILGKPNTFVNNSGISVAGLLQKYHTTMADLIVICDDLDLPLGKMRIRDGGGSGGHGGIKSIIASTNSQDFNRIKIGIGRPDAGQSKKAAEEAIVSYVLSDFHPNEEETIKSAINRAVEAIEYILSDGILAAMNKFN